ncbi:unnamed protein product [Prorocentrum cordatum]|uniref:Ribosome biogenesis protein NOP53 n=1 Tax=Prorocentrum cordatum TaxID=2364126 RepID=A0ABN9P8W3_9DINO|nr:unnamed protein product [Polarella glacialis]
MQRNTIRDSKPLGARLDEARAASARAQARRAEAAKALELAQAAIVASEMEIASFTANVEELEKSTKSAGDVAADVAMDSPSGPKDVPASIGTQLQSRVATLQTDSHVNPLHTEAAGKRDDVSDEEFIEVPWLRHSTKKPPLKQSTLFGHGFTAVRKSVAKPKN